MSKEDRAWLASRVSLGQALTAIGIADVGDLELTPHSSKTLVFRCNGLVYRFATSAWQASRMERELELLARIGPRLPCRIPEIVESSSHPVFHAYREIAGVSLREEPLTGCKPSWRDKVFTLTARFFIELHQCDIEWCRDEDRRFGSRLTDFRATADLDYCDEIDPSGTARRFVEESIETYDGTRPDAETAVLLHDDLVGANILIDPLTGNVSGIVDFTDWLVGDHHRDFSRVRDFGGDDGLKSVARIYEAECGRHIDLDFVMAIERARLCRGLLGADRSQQPKIDWFLDRMRAWRPIA